jgi:bifunctional non-homologous end joining protein LigD
VLRTLLDTSGPGLLKCVDHQEGDGATVFQDACSLGVKGIVSKLASPSYKSGTRREWVKVQCPAWREVNKDRFERLC